jgi:hypothetical protein
MEKYRKAIVAVVGFAVLAATAVFGLNPPTWFGPLVGFLTAIGVYQLPNARS